MAMIRATCQDCGDVELTTADVTVRVCNHDESGTYRFRCPLCRMTVAKPAEPRVVDLLVASGVTVSRWDLPAELTESRSGPAIDHDDLLDFHALLNGDECWMETLVRMTDK